jgi:predicted nucleic acid-binding protein
LILLDSSGLFAALSGQEPAHVAAASALAAERGPLVLSPFVLAELDYLVARSGLDSELGLLEQVAAGTYQLAPFAPEDVAQAAQIMRQYGDLRIGLADASIVVLANRHDTNRVLTLDERHFRALRTSAGKPFTILPADA